MSLTVAVTGPTGEIGKPFIRALERHKDVTRVLGMARRPFDPKAHKWSKTEYRQGDVLDRAAVDALCEEADVVVHLAFIIVAGSSESRKINLEGSRNVFEAAVQAKVARLVYASSVAAYGFHEDNPLPLTEDIPARGTEAHPYSADKAAVEDLLGEVVEDSETDAYVFRPCIVAGPEAPILKPVLPDPGVPFQLVHHDDVALALRAAVLGRGAPGVYNLAGDGEVTMRDLADALGYYTVPIPELAVDATAEIFARLPFLPDEASWIEAARIPVIMDTSKARSQLQWRPRHDALETLKATVEAHRQDLSA
jgi:nucleoside-diphosphate-sugar epimerase